MEEERYVLIQIIQPLRNTFLSKSNDDRFEIGIAVAQPPQEVKND